jgi:uncharacterized membrane protein HdeD (DUF308 family)
VAMREGARELSGYWAWFLIVGIVWTGFGMYVLSFRVGSLAAVVALVGVALLGSGITQLVVASRVQSWRWLYVLSGILGLIAGIATFVWPDITLYVVSVLVAWYLIVFGIIHLIDALAGPKLAYWWTGLAGFPTGPGRGPHRWRAAGPVAIRDRRSGSEPVAPSKQVVHDDARDDHDPR